MLTIGVAAGVTVTAFIDIDIVTLVLYSPNQLVSEHRFQYLIFYNARVWASLILRSKTKRTSAQIEGERESEHLELIWWREWWQQNHNNSNKQVTYPINSYIICLFFSLAFVSVIVIVVFTLVWRLVFDLFSLSLYRFPSLIYRPVSDCFLCLCVECLSPVLCVFLFFLVRLLVS